MQAKGPKLDINLILVVSDLFVNISFSLSLSLSSLSPLPHYDKKLLLNARPKLTINLILVFSGKYLFSLYLSLFSLSSLIFYE